jgi:hypothetical protein
MIAYAKLIKDCKRWAKSVDYDRYTILAWRLKRRWTRELRRRGLK